MGCAVTEILEFVDANSDKLVVTIDDDSETGETFAYIATNPDGERAPVELNRADLDVLIARLLEFKSRMRGPETTPPAGPSRPPEQP